MGLDLMYDAGVSAVGAGAGYLAGSSGKGGSSSDSGGGGDGGGDEERSYYDETMQTLQAQLDMAPQLLAAQQQYQPQYALLNVNTMKDMLSGPGGLLNYYENVLVPSEARQQATANRMQRQANISDIQTLGPQSTAAMRAMDPQSSALMNLLNSQAQEELAAGGNLTPQEQRTAQQTSRAAYSARGMPMGNNAMAQEVLNADQLSQQRLAQRQSFAGNVVGLNKQVYQDPFLSMLGIQSPAVGQASGMQSGANSYNLSGPTLFNPESAYASALYSQNSANAMDMWNTQYNAGVAKDIASANNTAALWSSGINALGSIAGGGMRMLGAM